MKPIDIVEELVGDYSAATPLEDMASMFHNCTKHNSRLVTVDFIRGVVEVFADDNETIEKTYAIRATLEPITTE